MTAPTKPRTRGRADRTLDWAPAWTAEDEAKATARQATQETLPAAVRDLLDKARQWPEYETYFRTEAERLLGRPIPTNA